MIATSFKMDKYIAFMLVFIDSLEKLVANLPK